MIARIIACLLLAGAPAHAAERQSVLAVFAHPDDDLAIGPVLTKLAVDYDVHAVYVSDGRLGVREHAGLKGDALIAAREAEARCAAEKRGGLAPVFLRYPDQIAADGDIGDQFARLKAASDDVAGAIARVNPAIILSFAPGGDTGHPDHRLTGDIAAAAFMGGAAPGARLFQFGWTKAQAALLAEAVPSGLVAFEEKFFDVAIEFSADDEAAEEAAVRCYATQFTPEEMEAFIALERAEPSNARWFREVKPAKRLRDKF